MPLSDSDMLDSQAGPSKPEQLIAIDASNHVSFESEKNQWATDHFFWTYYNPLGATIHVSDSATASFLIGAQIKPERSAEKQAGSSICIFCAASC
jgi:hypothetical protein